MPKAREIKAPTKKGTAPGGALETAAEAGKGVVVECVAEGSRLRVRPVSKGYRKDWHVQFPKDVREAGARYVVEELRDSARGGFYRAYGEIKKLAGEATTTAGRKKRN